MVVEILAHVGVLLFKLQNGSHASNDYFKIYSFRI